MKEDSSERKQVTKALKIKYQKVSTFLKLSQQVSFDLFILFLLAIGRNGLFQEKTKQGWLRTWNFQGY